MSAQTIRDYGDRALLIECGSTHEVLAVADALRAGNGYLLDRLLSERSISVNTAAAGGNASLMTIG